MLPRASTTSGRARRDAVADAPADRPARMRRRPSGEPPPLPREDRWTRWVWVLAGARVLGAGLQLALRTGDVVHTVVSRGQVVLSRA